MGWFNLVGLLLSILQGLSGGLLAGGAVPILSGLVGLVGDIWTNPTPPRDAPEYPGKIKRKFTKTY